MFPLHFHSNWQTYSVWTAVMGCACLGILGCKSHVAPFGTFANSPTSTFVAPPPQNDIDGTTGALIVQNGDPYQVWETVVDVVRLYFDRIEHEYPCQRNGEIIVDGILNTYPQISATHFEPWRRDVVVPSDRTEATVQTVRRICSVRVHYTGAAYAIEVHVLKELEDLAKPSYAALPSSTFRLDTDVPEVNDPIAVEDYNQGWIPRGRDEALEQEIYRQLRKRLHYLLK